MATDDSTSTTGAKKTGSSEAPSTSQPRERSSAGGTPKRAPRARSQRKSGAQVAAEAARQLLELTGREAEGVTGLERTDDGWTVRVEVVEVRRIPDTTDVLALYEVEVDERGLMESYRRVRRYVRGVPGEE